MMSGMTGDISSANGWSNYTTLVTQVPSWRLILFHYPAPLFFIAMGMGRVTIPKGMVFLVAFTLFSRLVMVPLQSAWWRFMEFFG